MRKGKPRIDLDLIYPPFLALYLDALAACKARGAHYYPTCGTREYEEQARRFALYKAGEGTRAAPPGLSAHQYGIAIDSAPDGDLDAPGLQADYSARRYTAFGEEIARVGLAWGASFGDMPHVGWPGYVSARHLKTLRGIYLAQPSTAPVIEKLRAVWRYLDANPPRKAKP